MIDLHFSDEDIDPVKRIIKYIQTINELRKINIFITFRLHEYFDCEEIRVIVKEFSYRNIKIINVESTNVFNYLEKERVVIQDNDLCIIE